MLPLRKHQKSAYAYLFKRKGFLSLIEGVKSLHRVVSFTVSEA